MVRMGDIWDRTTEFLGDYLGQIVPLALLAIFVPTAINELLAPLWATGAGGAKAGLFVAYLALLAVQLWGQLAITALAIDPAIGGNAARTATVRLLPAIGIVALMMVAGIIAIIPVSLIVAASGIDMTTMQAGSATAKLSTGAASAIVIYSLVFVALAVFIVARLIVLWPVVVAERHGLSAIAHSFRLTRGLTWRIIGVLILFAVVYTVATLAARTVFGSVLAIVAGGEGAFNLAAIITGMIVAAVATVFTVLASTFCAKLYVAVRERAATLAAVI